MTTCPFVANDVIHSGRSCVIVDGDARLATPNHGIPRTLLGHVVVPVVHALSRTQRWLRVDRLGRYHRIGFLAEHEREEWDNGEPVPERILRAAAVAKVRP